MPLRLPATTSAVRLLGPACLLFCLPALLYTQDVIASSKATPRRSKRFPVCMVWLQLLLTRHVCETAHAHAQYYVINSGEGAHYFSILCVKPSAVRSLMPGRSFRVRLGKSSSPGTSWYRAIVSGVWSRHYGLFSVKWP